jgi:hypothetical protein
MRKAVLLSVDRVIEGLTDEHRDFVLREVIKTLQAML